MALRRARQCVDLRQSKLDPHIISEFTLAVDWMQDWTIHRDCKLDERAFQSQLARQLNIEVANASVRKQRFLVTCEYKIPTGPSCDDIKKAVELAGQRSDVSDLSMAHDIIVRVVGEHVTVTTETYPDFVLELKRALEVRRFEQVLRGGGKCFAPECGRYSSRKFLGQFCCHLCKEANLKMPAVGICRGEEHTADCDALQTRRTERLNLAPPILMSREPDVAILMACQVEAVGAIRHLSESCLQAIAASVGSKRARLHGQFKETTCQGRFVCDYLGGQRCGCLICGTKAM